MQYISDHARIVILEERLERLAATMCLHIANSRKTINAIGQSPENTCVISKKISKTFNGKGLWDNAEDEEIAKKAETVELKRELRCSLNRLRNPKEIS